MSTITKEQAQKIIEAADEVITALAGTNEDVHPEDSRKMCDLWDDLNDRYAPPEVVRELARIALASLEPEPVAYVDPQAFRNFQAGVARREWMWRNPGEDLIPVYTAPPAPVSVPVEVSWEDVPDEITEDDMEVALAWAHGFNQCRAAMLQGAENAESRCTIQTATALDSSPKNAESRCSNSPVIADGWVLVPVEPTAEMISSGIAVHYERSQIQIHDRPAPGPMECAYVAMLAAAPQQEVKS